MDEHDAHKFSQDREDEKVHREPAQYRQQGPENRTGPFEGRRGRSSGYRSEMGVPTLSGLTGNHVLFSIRKSPITRQSISLLENVLKASFGVVTIGSPLRLNEVLRRTGTPVA